MKIFELFEKMNRPTEKDYVNMADWLYKAIGKAKTELKLKNVKQIVSNYLDDLVYEYRDDTEAREKDINKIISIWMKME